MFLAASEGQRITGETVWKIAFSPPRHPISISIAGDAEIVIQVNLGNADPGSPIEVSDELFARELVPAGCDQVARFGRREEAPRALRP